MYQIDSLLPEREFAALPLVFAVTSARGSKFGQVSTTVSALSAIPQATLLKFSGPSLCPAILKNLWHLWMEENVLNASYLESSST
jgi:hypothetical protein